MKKATLSCDVISSTELPVTERRELEENIKSLLNELTAIYSGDRFYGRLIKGDYMECALENPKHSLRIALIIKSFIKSLNFHIKEKNKKLKHFREFGIRIAIAVAELETYEPENGIIDGKAIYLSGRALQNLTTSGKAKIVIKNTLFFISENIEDSEKYETLFNLLDVLISKCSSKQCEIVYHKLLGKNETDIASLLKKRQSTINQHSTAAGWNAIEKAVKYFENNIQ